MTHKEKSYELLHQGYHCSQALFGAFAEELGLDLKTAFKISTCFGGGMRQEESAAVSRQRFSYLVWRLGFMIRRIRNRRFMEIKRRMNLSSASQK